MPWPSLGMFAKREISKKSCSSRLLSNYFQFKVRTFHWLPSSHKKMEQGVKRKSGIRKGGNGDQRRELEREREREREKSGGGCAPCTTTRERGAPKSALSLSPPSVGSMP